MLLDNKEKIRAVFDSTRETITEDEITKALVTRHGQEVFQKLKDGRVAVAGLGGLGSNIAIALTRAGVGHLHIIDFDVVDLTNLNRQQYFLEHLGLPKTEALATQLARINPFLDLKVTTVKVAPENIGELFDGYDIVCEAFDNPEAKAMLTEEILLKHRDKVLVGASGLAGYKSGNTIKTKQLMKNFYLSGDETSDIDENGGLMAPRAALCAAHQANMILRLLLGETDV